jgi:pimeloyl-ACP methyl ester carboxylesterase
MTERTVAANGIEIWTEDFGNPADPTILLVMGAGAQAIMWDEGFCDALVKGGYGGAEPTAGTELGESGDGAPVDRGGSRHPDRVGRHVIRYDNRDTGQSTCLEFGENPYTVEDMARDAVGVLDAHGIDKAHVVGASMGGMICQVLASDHADRVITMTSIMSSPGGAKAFEAISTGQPIPGYDLPPPDQKVLDAMMAMQANPPTTRDQQIDAGVRTWRALSGSVAPFDEAEVREREGRVYDRARNISASMNHGFAVASSPDRFDTLGRITVPTLVIHGTEDPILPFPHGELTANLIPGAKLVAVEGMGHELPRAVWPQVVEAILEHTSSPQ